MSTQNLASENEPTETSPLISREQTSKTKNRGIAEIQKLASSGLVPTGISEGAAEAQKQSSDPEAHNVQASDDSKPSTRLVYVFLAVTIGVFMAAADTTIVVSSYGRIGSQLNALDQASWIATAYLLTVTAFQPLYGKLSDIFSRKSCLLTAYLIFGLGCLGCGLAQDMPQLVAARAFAGIGGGGLGTVASIILSDMVPLKDRGLWQGYANTIHAVGLGSGASLGGILADGIGWRWSFIGQVPICVIASVAVYFALGSHTKKESEVETKSWSRKLQRIDYLGAVLLISAVFCLQLGLERGSNVSWKTKATLVPLCLSGPLFALLIYVELRVAAEPFAPTHIIFNPSMLACYLCNFFLFAGCTSNQFYTPLYYQAVQNRTATQAGLLLISEIVTAIVGSWLAGLYVRKSGKYYTAGVVGYAGSTIGQILVLVFANWLVDSTPGMVVGSSLASFWRMFSYTTTVVAVVSNASRTDQATATALNYFTRSLGSSTGLALTSTVANQVLRTRLKASLGSSDSATEIFENVRHSLNYLRTLAPEVQELVRRCYGDSTRAAFAFDAALGAGAAVSAWFIVEKSLGPR